MKYNITKLEQSSSHKTWFSQIVNVIGYAFFCNKEQ